MISIKDAEEVLKHEYHTDNFEYIAKDILLPDFKKDVHDVLFKNNLFSSVTWLGESKQCDLVVFEVELTKGVENRRVAITQEMFKILKQHRINNALVAFSNADKNNYRISLLTSKYEYDGEKIVKVVSNPRRYSYSLGFGTKTKTANKFLINKGKVNSIVELTGRFSVEVVNKEFYSQIATCFTSLVGGEREGKKYARLLGLHGIMDNNKYAEFAVRLIGRIMFCWFLKEKKSEQGIALVPNEILSLISKDEDLSYYHNVLEPLFFELLNTNQNRRRDKFGKEDMYNQIPYLNGGLFSPHSDDLYKYSSATESGIYGMVNIPNSWFVNFYNVLSQYNFTVDENTSYDIELSIDPEMLGRIFENLLAEINPETGENAKKSTGSFYTPRDIVDYMVDSSILEYLKEKTSISEAKLKALISYGKEDDELAILDNAEKKAIINALYSVTILDPACGSGAFPIGMLQKIVYVLQEIDPAANLWFDKATESVGVLLKKEFEKKFNAGSLNYIRKLSVIQNSIFGVDIQPIAVEIARLRCFLSLVIEEKVDDNEENRGINSLPNLDFKFVIANSLIELENSGQMSLFENQDHISELKAVREEFFSVDDAARKADLKLEFAHIQKKMFQETISMPNRTASSRYKSLSDWAPFENNATAWFDPEWMFGIKNGFDIVIGNPPYGICFNKEEKKYLSKKFPNVPDYESADFFIDRSYEILNNKGLVNFIVPNMFLANNFAKKYREKIIKLWGITRIDNLSDSAIFEMATVRNAIIFFNKRYSENCIITNAIMQNSNPSFTEKFCTKVELLENIDNWLNIVDNDNPKRKIINQILKNSEPLMNYCEISQGLIPYDKYRGHSEETIKNRIWNSDYKKDETYKKQLRGKDVHNYSICWNGNDWLSYGNWLAAPRKKEFFTSERILIREITNPRILAAYCKEEFYNTPSIINCINFSIDIYFVLGLLNSTIFTFFHNENSPKAKKGLFPKILVSDIKKLPIRINSNLANQISKMSKKMTNDGFDIEMSNKIDQLVYELYGLTEEEIAIVDGK